MQKNIKEPTKNKTKNRNLKNGVVLDWTEKGTNQTRSNKKA